MLWLWTVIVKCTYIQKCFDFYFSYSSTYVSYSFVPDFCVFPLLAILVDFTLVCCVVVPSIADLCFCSLWQTTTGNLSWLVWVSGIVKRVSSATTAEVEDSLDAISTDQSGRPGKKRAKVWAYVDSEIVDGIEKVVCKYCKLQLSSVSGKGTTHLNRHIEYYCHHIPQEDMDRFLATLKKSLIETILYLILLYSEVWLQSISLVLRLHFEKQMILLGKRW